METRDYLPLTLRVATAREVDRSIEAVISTENKTAVFDTYGRSIIDEVLLAGGAKLPSQLVLLDGHARELDAVLGSVRNLRVEGSSIIGRLYFASDAVSERAWQKVRDGHVTDLSVGYNIDQAVEIPAGQSRIVNGRSFQAGPRTLRIVTRWTPRECSLVAVGADLSSHTRSLRKDTPMIRTLSEPADTLYRAIAPVVQRGGQGLTWAELSKACLRHLGQVLPPNDQDLIREAVSSAAIAETFGALLGSAIVRGFDAEPDTTLGWTREVPLPNFLPAELFALDVQTRLTQLARGGEAADAEYGVSKETWHLCRYARQFTVDEQDMIDGEPLGAVLMAVEQLGAAARRVRPDLVYSLILGNPALASDSLALFQAANHGNLGSGAGSAMGTAGLGAGIAAIGNQTYPDNDGLAIHVNNEARILVVPPDLVELSRRTLRNIVLGDGRDIEVRQESRLGTAGVLDPASEEIHTGTATNWLLCAKASSIPSLVVGGLDGSLAPSVRRFTLSDGQWGMGWDIILDIGAAALDYRGVYFSGGA